MKILKKFALLALPSLLFMPQSMAAEELVIISPHWEGIRKEFERGFNAWDKKGVRFRWLDQGGSSDALKFVKTRFGASPKGIGVDLFFGGGVDPYLELARGGLLVPASAPPTALKGIPPKIGSMPLYDHKTGWYGATVSGFGIFYNKALVTRLRLPIPQRWTDLTHPRLRGKVGAADPRHSGSIHLMLEMVLQGQGWTKGWGTLSKMVGNIKGFPESSSRAVSEVAEGGALYGLSVDYYAQGQIIEKGAAKLGFVYPKDIRVLNPDAIGMLKGAPNPSAAKRFLTFVLSDAGQKLWLTPKGRPGGPKEADLVRHSVRPYLYKGVHFKILQSPFSPAMSKGLMRYDAMKGAKRWNIVNDLFGTWFITPHKTWVALAKAGKLSPALMKPPVSEAQLFQLLPKWQDATFRAKTMSAWEKQVLAMLRKAGG